MPPAFFIRPHARQSLSFRVSRCRERGVTFALEQSNLRPALVTTLACDLYAIGNHPNCLVLTVLKLGGRFIARERVVVIGQVDDCCLAAVVAAKERWALVQTLADEGGDRRDNGHARQASIEGLHIRRKDLRAVGEIIGGISAVVVDDNNVDGVVEERPDWIVLESFTAVDEVEFGLCGYEG